MDIGDLYTIVFMECLSICIGIFSYGVVVDSLVVFQRIFRKFVKSPGHLGVFWMQKSRWARGLCFLEIGLISMSILCVFGRKSLVFELFSGYRLKCFSPRVWFFVYSGCIRWISAVWECVVDIGDIECFMYVRCISITASGGKASGYRWGRGCLSLGSVSYVDWRVSD